MHKLPFLLLLLPLAGCGAAGPKLYEVTGTVTFDGKPIPDGDIIFAATDTISEQAGKIENGQFLVLATAGNKQVRIFATREAEFDKVMNAHVRVPYIPDRYNTKTTLTADVTASGPNKFTFDLSSKPDKAK